MHRQKSLLSWVIHILRMRITLHPDTMQYGISKMVDKKLDVVDVKQTWWWQVIKDGGYKLGVNNSFSGATICYSGYNDEDYSARSFVRRWTNLGTPDIIFIFCGTKWQLVRGTSRRIQIQRPNARLVYFQTCDGIHDAGNFRIVIRMVKLYFIANTELKMILHPLYIRFASIKFNI